MSRFHYLMHRFFENKATEEERLEFMKQVDSGRHDEELQTEWDEILKTRLETGEPADEKLEGMVQKIRDRVGVFDHYSVKAIPMYKPAKAKRWVWISAAATVAILMISSVLLFIPNMHEATIVQENSPAPSSFTGKQYIALPDGTTVLLNEASELSYEGSYGEGTREVFLSGEAYFDVKHNPTQPFIVHTGKVKTTVLGTAFNVKAYEEQQQVVVTVTRGKVAVSDDERVYGQLLPDEQLAVNTMTFDFEKRNTNAETAIEWKSQFLILDNITMEEAARLIGERFNTSVTIINEDLKKCKVNGTFLNGEGVEHVVMLICRITKTTYTMKDGNVTIHGGISCK